MPKFVLRVFNAVPSEPHPDPVQEARRFKIGDVVSIIPLDEYQPQWNKAHIKPVVVEAASIDDLAYLTESDSHIPDDFDNVPPKRKVRIDLNELRKSPARIEKTDATIGALIEFTSLAPIAAQAKVAALSAKEIADIDAEKRRRVDAGELKERPARPLGGD